MAKYGLELKAWELICYCILFVVGVIGNLIVCVVVMKSRSRSGRMRDVPFNIYLMSLAIADMALAVVSLPVYLLSTTTFSHPTGTKGTILCKLFTGYLLPFWFGSVSVYTLVIISFERYTAISKPFVAMTKSVSKVTALYIGSAWLIGLVLQLTTIVGVGYHPSHGRYSDYIWSKTTGTIAYATAFTFQYVVPAIILVVNFYRIERCLAKIEKSLRSKFKNDQFMSIMKAKKKTIRIVCVVSAAFFICWTPNAVMYFLFKYAGSHSSWRTDIYRASIVLPFFNSCVNPFLYAFQSKEFQGHCKKVFKQIFPRQTGEQQSSSAHSSSSNKTNVRFKRLVELKANH